MFGGADLRNIEGVEEVPAALAELMTRQMAVLTVAQAAACLGRDAVRWRVKSGRWQRRYARVLVAHSGPLTAEQEQWAVVLHCGSGAVLGHETAAALCGLRGYEDTRIHVLVPSHRHPHPSAGWSYGARRS